MQPMGGTSLSARHAALRSQLHAAIAKAGAWLPFDRFMALALYAPGLGYYAAGNRQFGSMPSSGSDFVTAPELSPLFGRALARQVSQALHAAQAHTVLEFGAGSGALAEQLLHSLGERVRRYAIVDVSGSLRAVQAERLAPFGARVQWLDALPEQLHGVIIGNEVLDAMPVQLLHWDGSHWHERGVVSAQDGQAGALQAGEGAAMQAGRDFGWADRPTTLRPPHDAAFVAGTVIEIHPQAEAFVRTVADRLQRGAAFFIDYGFPEAEYYHPQRVGGTLMCHRGHRADADPLTDVGSKDITAHVNFSAMALAGQDAGLDVLGYTSQARFLMNCGLLELLQGADIRTTAVTQKLLNEHEMGELFKVIGFARGVAFDAIGFATGDRSHSL